MADAEEEGFDVEFTDAGISRDLYECPICHLAFRNPYQLRDCGHRFCKRCIDKVLTSSRTPLCPVDRQPFTKGTIFEDKGCKRAVLSFKIFCPLKESGCEWKGELGNVEDHKLKCRAVVICCTNSGCDTSFPRLQELEHKSKCLRRVVGCGYCDEKFPIMEEEKHESVCSKLPVKCELCDQDMIPRDMMNQHLEAECLKSTINCPYKALGCEVTEERSLMDIHLKESVQEHLALACAMIMALTDQKERRHSRRISTRGSKLETLENVMAAKSTDHTQPKYISQRIPYTTYVWKIDKILDKIHSKNKIKSDAYYTGPNKTGYKFFVYFASADDEDGDDDKDISVYIRIARSDSDCLLSWPFRRKLFITIINQKGESNLTEDLGDDRDSKAFQRPVGEENAGIGFAEWLKLSELKRVYIHNNSVVLKIEVEPTKMLTDRFA